MALAWLLAAGCTTSEAKTSEATTAAASSPVRWVRAEKPSDLTMFEVPAQTRPTAGQLAAVTSPVRARLLQVHVQTGDRVVAGQPVVTIASPELAEAAARRQSAARRIDAYQRHAAELKSLEKDGLVKRVDRFATEAELADLQAERAGAEALLRGAGLEDRDVAELLARGRTSLRAPIDGAVLRVRAVTGAAVEAGAEPLVEVAGLGPTRVEARLLRPLPDGVHLTFATTTGQSIELAGTPTSTAVDPQDGSLIAWFELAAPEPLPAGLRGRVRIAAVPDGLLQVPVRAVLRRDGQALVLVRPGVALAGKVAVPQEKAVEVVAVAGATALVRGLQAGTEVVAEADRAQAPSEVAE